MNELSLVEETYSKVGSALHKAGRSFDDIKIVVVSKNQSIETIESFLKHKKLYWSLGESYLDELETKTKLLSHQQINWHYIGKLQSRKIPVLLNFATCLHSVGRVKELEVIAKAPIDFFAQINISKESSKNGFETTEMFLLQESIDRLGLKNNFKGLMAMPSPADEVGESKLRAQLQELSQLRDKFFPNAWLNMGTTQDYEWAIEEGSQVLRLGTCLLGART